MLLLRQKSNNGLSGFPERVLYILFFILAFATHGKAEVFEPEVKDSLSIVSSSATKSIPKITGKIYVIEGTLTSNLENNSAEIVHIPQKAKVKKASHNKEVKKETVKLQKEVKSSDVEEQKDKELAFHSSDSRTSILLKLPNSIKSVIPVTMRLLKLVIMQSNFKTKRILILANCIQSQKINFPFFLTMEKSQLYSSVWSVRPPPAPILLS